MRRAEGWLNNVRADLGKVLHYRDVCIADNDHQAAAQWTGHARKYFEMIGHAAEQLKAHSINIQNNFYNSPDYWLIQNAILGASLITRLPVLTCCAPLRASVTAPARR